MIKCWVLAVSYFLLSYAFGGTLFQAHIPKKGEHVLTWIFEHEQKNWGSDISPKLEVNCPMEQKVRQEWTNSRTFKAWLSPGPRPGDKCSVRFNNQSPEHFAAEKISILEVSPYLLYNFHEDSAMLISADSPVNLERFLKHSYLSIDGIEEKIDLELLPDPIVVLLEKAFPHYQSDPVVPLALAKKNFWIRPKRILPNDRKFKLVVEEDECLAYSVEGQTRPAFRLEMSCSRYEEGESCSPISPIDIFFTASVEKNYAKNIKIKIGNEHRAPKIENEDNSLTRLRFFPPFPENSKLELSVPSDLVDLDGRKLENIHKFPLTISMAEAPALAKFNGTFGILEAKTDAKYPLAIRNVDDPFQVDIAAYKINLEQGIDKFLLWQSQIHDTRYEYDDVLGPNLKYTKSILSKSELAKAERFNIRSSVGKGEIEMVGIPLKGPALYLLEFSSPKLGKQYLNTGNFYNSSLALVTNLMAHLKMGQENTLVWVTELDSGQVRQGARVDLYDCRGRKLETGKTNIHGVIILKTKYADYSSCESGKSFYPSQTLYAVASYKDDTTLTKSSWDQGIESWRFQLPYYYQNEGVEYHLVFDRPVYQKGEKVSFLGLARKVFPNKLTYPKQVLDSKIKIVHVGSEESWYQKITWDKKGSFVSSFQLGKDFANGSYSIYLTQDTGNNKQAQDRGQYLGQFKVESFQLPFIELKSYWKGDNLKGMMTYLSGGLANEIPVSARGVLTPSYLEQEDFPGVNFANGGFENLENSNPGQDLPKQETRSNNQGEIEFKFGAMTPKDYLQRLDVELEFFDANGEYQIENNHKLIFPGENLVGIEKLQETDNQFKIYLIDNNKKIIAGKEVSASLFKRVTNSVRKKIIGGFYSYDNQISYKEFGQVCMGKTNHRGVLLCQVKMPEENGQFYLTAESKDEHGIKSRASVSFWKYGEEYWAGAQANDRVDLLADQITYQIGDTANLELQIPFEKSTVLLTRERTGILDYQIVNMGRERPIIPFDIKASDAPNIYVSALAVRGRLEEAAPFGQIDLGRPAMKMGLREIKVFPSKREIDFSLSSDKEVYQVRETVKAKIDIPDERRTDTRFAIAVFDSGLLKMAGHSSFEMENTFKQMFDHKVNTASAQSMVVGKRHFGLKARPHGGGGGAIKREFFDSLLYWSPRLSADAKGQLPFQFKVNDSLTEFTIFALAYNQDTFTLKTHQIKSAQDILTFPGISNYLRFKDRSPVRMTLKNTTDRVFDIKAEYTNSLGERMESKLKLAANAAETLIFDFMAPTEKMTLVHELSVYANGKLVDNIKKQQEIIPLLEEKSFAGDLYELDKKHVIELPKNPQLSTIHVSFSRSVLPSSTPIKNFLDSYNYSCLEQQLAKAVVLSGPHLKKFFNNLPKYFASGNLLSFFPDNENYPSLWLTLHLLEVSYWSKITLPKDIVQRIEHGLIQVLDKGYYSFYNSQISLSELDKIKIKAILKLRNSPLYQKSWSSESVRPELLNIGELQYHLILRPGDASISKSISQRYQLKGAIFNLAWSAKDTSKDYFYANESMIVQIRQLLIAQNKMLDANSEKLYSLEHSKYWRGLAESYRNTWQDNTVLASYMMSLINSIGEQGKISGKTTVGDHVATWGSSVPQGVKFIGNKLKEKLQLEHQGRGVPYVDLKYYQTPLFDEKRSRGFDITSLNSFPQNLKSGDRFKRQWKVDVRDEATMSVLKIPVPAGARVIDSNIDSWYLYRELDDKHLKVYFSSNPIGTFNIDVTYIFDRPGDYQIPGASIEEMYSPDRFAIEKGEPVAIR